MDRARRVESLQRAYADFPSVQKTLVKLAAANFAELQELIEQHLGHLERAALEIDSWNGAKRAELEKGSQQLYDSLVRLETALGNALATMPAGRPN